MGTPPTTGPTIDLTTGTLPRLYGVLDVATLVRLGLARPGPDLAAAVAAATTALVTAGVGLLQLRGKGLEAVEALRVTRAVVRAAHEASARALVLVNDDPALARRGGADGVHLGAGDPSPEQARRLLGADAVIGATVRGVADLPVAQADYVGVGPVRATSTKPGLPPPLGFDGLAAVAAHATVPVFGIGGLRPGDAATVRRGGAHGAAMVTGLLEGLCAEGADVASRVAQFASLWDGASAVVRR